MKFSDMSEEDQRESIESMVDDDRSQRLKEVNEKIEANADRFWEQAYKNLEELTKGISQREDGTIVLDANNPYHVAWFELEEDEENE